MPRVEGFEANAAGAGRRAAGAIPRKPLRREPFPPAEIMTLSPAPPPDRGEGSRIGGGI
jgi:hypothetical protein